MDHLSTGNPTAVAHHFAGMAANESFGMADILPHQWLINRLNADIPFIIDSFYLTMTSILKKMDIDYAVSKQNGMVDGVKMKPGQTPEQTSVHLAFWESLESSLWAVAVQSYHDHVLHHDPEKYKKICLTMSPESADALLAQTLIQNEQASQEVGAAFQMSLLDEVEALNKLKAMITHHIPHVQVDINMRMEEVVGEKGVSHQMMMPIIILTALEDLDLRVPLRHYVGNPQGVGPAGLRPA